VSIELETNDRQYNVKSKLMYETLHFYRPNGASGKTSASGAGGMEPIKSPTRCQRLATAAFLMLDV